MEDTTGCCTPTVALPVASKACPRPLPPTPPCTGCAPPQVENLNIGIKDTSKGVFAVWDELLHLPSRGAGGALGLGRAGGQGRVQALYSALQDFGEHELVRGVRRLCVVCAWCVQVLRGVRGFWFGV